MQNRYTTLVIIALFTSCCLLGAGCTRKDDLSGTWKGRITLPATGKSLTDLEFTLVQKGREVTGTMVFTKPGAKLPLAGTVNEGQVSLKSSLKNGLAVSINGAVQTRKKISGTAVLQYDTQQLGKRKDTAQVELTR